MAQEYNSYHHKLAKYAKAISHPIRLQILEMLLKNEVIYSGQMVDLLPIARSTLSQHLSELKSADLIIGKPEMPRIAYSINRKNWEEAKHLLITFFE